MRHYALTAVLSLIVLSALPTHAAPGKFYLIGMGTAPDLVTVRGAEIIKKTDIFLLEEPFEKEYWKDYVGDKEVWYCPHASRIFYGVDPNTLEDEDARKLAERNAKFRQDTIDRIKAAVEDGKIVSSLQGGDCMIYGTTFYLEMLPKDFPSEVVPGISAFNAASAAVKMSPTFGYDTDSVVLTMADWPGRKDTGEKFMSIGTSLVYYTMHLDYPQLFAQLKQHYHPMTPVAVVSYAGDLEKQQVIRSTVGKFLEEVEYKKLPPDMHMLLVGKFLVVGQGRLDGVETGKDFEELLYGTGRDTK